MTSRKSMQAKTLPTFHLLQVPNRDSICQAVPNDDIAHSHNSNVNVLGYVDEVGYTEVPNYHKESHSQGYHYISPVEPESYSYSPYSSSTNSSTAESVQYSKRMQEQYYHPQHFEVPPCDYHTSEPVWAIPVEMISSSERKSKPIPAIVLQAYYY
jgi:hypothetical protein